jgi:hypothetical protein
MAGRKTRKRAPRTRQQSGPQIRWDPFPEMLDDRGRPFKRAFQLETMASAIERRIRTSDRFILPSIETILGQGKISTLSFKLAHEDRRRLIFDIRALNARKKRGRFSLVVAKNPVAFSDILEIEFKNLQGLSGRAPDSLLEVYRGGKIFLPDRHRREENGRELYAYVAGSVTNSSPLGVGRNGQLVTRNPKLHTFTRKATEELKGLILDGVLGSYDPEKCACIAIDDLGLSDIFVQTTRHGKHKIRIVSCPKVLTRVSPVRALRLILATTWRSEDVAISLALEDPGALFAQVVRSWGAAAAADSLGALLRGNKGQRGSELPPEYFAALAETVSNVGGR